MPRVDPIAEFLNRYVAVWNEGDAERRRQLADRTWTHDAVLVNALARHAGVVEIASHVSRSHDEFVARGGHRFGAVAYLAHHDGILFDWEMGANNAAAVSAGTNYLLRGVDGRIRLDHQFLRR
jgi:hypothetical protein